MILFILGESGSGKTTLEHHLVNNYGFKMFKKYSTRPIRGGDDKSGYSHVSPAEMMAMWMSGEIDECVKYNGEFYGMSIPKGWNDDSYVVVLTESGFQQFIDMGIEDTHDIASIFLTNDNCEELMRKRGDDESSIQERLRLNARMRDHMGMHNIISGNGGTEAVVTLLQLMYPSLFN